MQPQLEIVYENQRGTYLKNNLKFNSKSLLPTDYPNYSSIDGKFSVPKEMLLLSKTQEWISDWIIDRQGQVDEDGWVYAQGFKKGSWSDTPSTSTYVRRRKWIRMFNNLEPQVQKPEETESLNAFSKCKIDRERFNVFKSLVEQDKYSDQMSIFELFETENIRVEALKLLVGKIDRESLLEMVVKLKFYSDRIAFS